MFENKTFMQYLNQTHISMQKKQKACGKNKLTLRETEL